MASVCYTTFDSHTFDYTWTIRNVKSLIESHFGACDYNKCKACINSPKFSIGLKIKEVSINFTGWCYEDLRGHSHIATCANGDNLLYNEKEKCQCVELEVSLNLLDLDLLGVGFVSILVPNKDPDTHCLQNFVEVVKHDLTNKGPKSRSSFNSKLSVRISRDELNAGCSKYTYEDSLTVYCKVTVYAVDHELNHITDSIPSIPHVSLASVLKKDRDQKLYTDAIIKCGSKAFDVHRIVIGSQSAFFKKKMEHWEKGDKTIDMSDLKPQTVEAIVDHMYTGEVANIDEQAPDLLAAAEKYQLFSLKNLCEKALVRKLTDSNVAHLLKLASTHNALDLKQKVVDFAYSNPLMKMQMLEAWTDKSLSLPN
ncbi:speckle-type POZ protein-like [Halichondria panicea]|uniref:speckle-type POZ protein-like n=1 Tax=Halichondria panicea TaxID=6063 RepID=UPI00312B99FA